MGTLIGSRFRNAQQLQLVEASSQYGYKTNPTWKADNLGAFFFTYTPTTVLSSGGVNGLFGYGVNDAGNNSRFFIGQRYLNSGPGSGLPRIEIDSRLTNGGTINLNVSTTALVSGTTYRICVTTNGSIWKLYINGVADTIIVVGGSNTGDWTGDVSGASHTLMVGGLWLSNSPGNYANCKLDEVWYLGGREATLAEAQAYYNSGQPINPYRLTSLIPDLRSWWRMGDSRDDATTVYDEIGTNNLTLVNSPSYVAA